MLEFNFAIPELEKDALERYKQKLAKAIEKVTQLAYEHIVEKAGRDLNTRKDTYLKALHPPQKISDLQWSLELDDEAKWIEEGIPANFDMLPGLLNSPKAKQGKNGKYIIIPFKHNGSGPKTAVQTHLSNQVRSAMQDQGIPWNKIEKSKTGEHKLGLLHKMDVNAKPMHQPIMGTEGPTGRPMKSKEGRSFLKGISVYQHKMGGETQRDVMTFRTASESQKGKKWIHPGLQGFKGFPDAYSYAQSHIQEIFDSIEDEQQ